MKAVKKLQVILPIALEWRVTDSCNLKCTYCSQYKPGFHKNDYTDTLERVIALGPKHIWLGGGEPTIVEQLPEIAGKLKSKLNAHIGINTNLTNEKAVKGILPFIDDLIISIDTADAAVSGAYRGIRPEIVLETMERICREADDKMYPVNITVNSVVFKDSIEGDGIEELNDKLNKIRPGIWHMFCPLYPKESSGSIINDRSATDKFLSIINRLKAKKRNLVVDFPQEPENGKFVSKTCLCYRRYFRVQLIECGEFFSPCPEAHPLNPVCGSPCNCAAFLESVISMNGIDSSPLRGRMNNNEIERLKEFHKLYKTVKPGDNGYDQLTKNECKQ